jgi:hypothetical protein
VWEKGCGVWVAPPPPPPQHTAPHVAGVICLLRCLNRLLLTQ